MRDQTISPGNIFQFIMATFVVSFSISCGKNDVNPIPNPTPVVTKTAGVPEIETYASNFEYITAITTDANGNVYVADGALNEIIKINASDKSMVIVAGKHSDNPQIIYDGDGGVATSAHLNLPIGIAVAASGNIYIADVGNNVIRKVTATTGIISTIAGKGIDQGYSGDNGPATEAKFFASQDVAVDAAENVYIADTENNAVRKISVSTGIVTTIAGLGPDQNSDSGDGGLAKEARISSPEGIAIDAAGNIYISEIASSVIRKIDASTGIITTIAGKAGRRTFSGDGGLAKSATLSYPNKISFDANGDLLIGDSGNSLIRKITMSTGIINTVAGSGKAGYTGDGGDATAATLNNPVGACADAKGNVFIGDQQNAVVRIVK